MFEPMTTPILFKLANSRNSNSQSKTVQNKRKEHSIVESEAWAAIEYFKIRILLNETKTMILQGKVPKCVHLISVGGKYSIKTSGYYNVLPCVCSVRHNQTERYNDIVISDVRPIN